MIDVIGILHAPVVLPEGWAPDDPLPPAEALPGWHVNVTAAVVESRPELAAHMVEPHPASLMRAWAGDDPANPVHTVPLRFESEAAALAALDGLIQENPSDG